MKSYDSLDYARAISLIFLPPFNSLAIFIYFSLNYETGLHNIFYGILIAFLCGTFIPILSFNSLRKRKHITDQDASIKRERSVPYLIGIMLCITALSLSILLKLDIHIVILWITYISVTFLLLIINKFWKISAHAVGFTVPMGALLFTEGLPMLPLLIPLLLIWWSRMKLNIHNIFQLAAGSILGLLNAWFYFSLLINS